jgi:uncharacterized protein YndB with AHSA1/START domain
MLQDVHARVTMFIHAPPDEVYSAFVDPIKLVKFWLAEASAPLQMNEAVHWTFLVPGAEIHTTATIMEPGKRLAWRWSDGTKVNIDFDPLDGGTAVTLVNGGFPQKDKELVDAALNATEGFAFVLADLKTLLESGTSAGISKAKAKLITLRA